MNTKTKALLLTTIACWSQLTFGDTKNIIIGAGISATCMDYNKGTGLMKTTIIAWTQGYLSGRNLQLDRMNIKMKVLPESEEIRTMFDINCKSAIDQGFRNMPIGVMVDKVFTELFTTNLNPKE